MLLKLKDEIKNLRKSLRKNPYVLADSDKTHYKEILPSSSESPNQKKGSFRESAQARRARLNSWTPSAGHSELAAKRGHDDAWLNRQAELYRLHQVNAKTKHKDFDAGFTSWILRAETFEGKPNGHRRPRKLSTHDETYAAFFRAAEKLEQQEKTGRADRQSVEPLLDC